jgi:dihydropteroate synthase
VLDDGADLLDIGGESTPPRLWWKAASAVEELRRYAGD